MSKQKKKQLDLSEVGEPIENTFQDSENSITSFGLTNIINDNMLPVKKDIDNLEIENNETTGIDINQEDNEYDEDENEYEDDYTEEGDDNGDEYTEEGEYSEDDESNNNDHVDSVEVLHAKQLVAKRDLVYKIQQLQQKLYDVELSPKTFTTADSLSELQSEYDRLTRIKQQKNTRDWYRKILFGVTKGIEWANHKWDPVGLKLDGWSTEVASNVDEFDEIFDELSEKYGGTVASKMSPEIRLIILILYSGISYSISQTLVQDHSNRPEFTEIINKDPVLRERFMRAATEAHMEKAQPQVSQLLNSVKEILTPDNQQNNMKNFMSRLDDSELNVNELGL